MSATVTIVLRVGDVPADADDGPLPVSIESVTEGSPDCAWLRPLAARWAEMMVFHVNADLELIGFSLGGQRRERRDEGPVLQ